MTSRRSKSMFSPYGFVPFDGSTMQQVPLLHPHQQMFFSPASSVGSIPAMMEVQQVNKSLLSSFYTNSRFRSE